MFLAAVVSVALSYDVGRIRQVEQLIQFHRFWDAYTALNDIIGRERAPVNNYLYKLRAQCCLNMAMVKECVDATNAILNNSPSAEDSKWAHTIKARALIQHGEYKQAEAAARSAGDGGLLRDCAELMRLKSRADSYAKNGQISEAGQAYDQLLRHSSKCLEIVLARANVSWTAQDYGRYFELTNDIANQFPSDGTIAYRRGFISFCDGKLDVAMRGLAKAAGLKGAPKSVNDVLGSAREVNRLYPQAQRQLDGGELNAANATIADLREHSDRHCWRGSVLTNSILILEVRLLRKSRDPKVALEILNQLIDSNPNFHELYLERGDLNIDLKEYDAAIFDFTIVQRASPNQRAQEGLQRANDLKKQATFVDHYAILGVTKRATIDEVKQAYKKMARQWHPDRFGDPVKKKEAEVMMKKLNTAVDILGDREKKRRYDAGQDPDEVQPQGNPFGGGFPFGGFNFQGGGFQFHFGGGQQFQFHFG
jgi:tetratricopeptide (TPR) repeat protein